MSPEFADPSIPHSVAFFGRPNAGKSICANRLFGVDLRVGKTPGSTRRIQLVEKSGVLIADLPGWGLVKKGGKFATSRAKSQILRFFEENSGLIHTLVVVVDISTYQNVSRNLDRKGLLPVEVDAIQSLSKHVKSVVLIANKTDKLTKPRLATQLSYLKASLKEHLGIELTVLTCSAKKDSARDFDTIRECIFKHGQDD